jgi:NAD(P)-dependent dehydrogenase (short-subunit alcohol dehydrogenase family)
MTRRSMLITGAGGGIGAAIAHHASEAGYLVGVMDADEVRARDVAERLKHGVALAGDVRDAADMAAAVRRLGDVNVLVNNAGILRTGPLIDHNPDDFRLVMDVNLNGAFIAAQAAARHMRDHGGGVIINISSINGIHPSPNCGAYVAAKAGLIGLTQQMSLEWGAYGIRVNAIAPGFIDGGMSSQFYANTKVRARRSGAVPLGRLGTVDDVAAAAMFLASDAAAYINGHTLTVDGGVINSVLLQLPRE